MKHWTGFICLFLLFTAVTLSACTSPDPTAVPPISTPVNLTATATTAVSTTAPADPAGGYTAVISPPTIAEAYPAPEEVVSSAPVYTYRIVNQYPHDPVAFTQGLVWLDGEFYEGTGLHGESSLRRVDPETGEVEQVILLPESYFGEGITLWDDKIIQITWQEQTAFIYDQETFAQEGQFSYETEGWGVTHDGRQLIMSDGTNTLYFRDPETFMQTGQVQVLDGATSIARLNELEYINGEVWANIWQTDRIVRIDPTTGQVIGWIDLAGLRPAETQSDSNAVLNGIAYDAANGRIFVTGKRWPVLFEIEVVPVEP